GSTPDALMAAADLALRWAKQRGKGIAVEFDRAVATAGDLTVDSVHRLWQEDLIDIVVQPIVELRTGRSRSFEALARFRGEGGPSPLPWFVFAERHGLRAELELACLTRALELLPTRPPGTQLSVNLSPELLVHPEAQAALRDVQEPSAVVIELTENAVVHDYE